MLLAFPAWAQWSLEADAGLRHDNNLGNARNADDRVGDYSRSLSLTASQAVILENGDTVVWGGRMEGESFSNLHDLNNAGLGAFFAYSRKFGLGPYAPRLNLAWSSTHLAFQNDARNGWLHRAEIGLSRRLDERWSLSGQFRLERRTARTQPEDVPGVSGDVFSQRSRSLILSADYAPRDDMALTLGALVRRGDVVSTVLDEDVSPPGVKAIAEDKAFGDEAYAYRLTGDTYGGSLAYALRLGRHSSLRFQLLRQVTTGTGGYTYTKTVQTLDWIATF